MHILGPGFDSQRLHKKERILQQILIGTNNKGKINEYRILLQGFFNPVSLESLGIDLNVEETGNSYEENAILKLQHLIAKSPIPVITDDSGIEVSSLNDEPGIFSARYAGENATDQQNIDKLLNKINGNTDRRARFVCFIAFGDPSDYSSPIIASGESRGVISEVQEGKNGFGYDSIFYNEQLSKTFAQLHQNEKILISHRAEAVKDLLIKLNI